MSETERTITKVVPEILPDQTALVLTWFEEGCEPYGVRTSTAALDETIATLGLCRTGLLPPVPATWTSQPVEARRDPAWSLETDALAGDSLLHIRDARFGWLHYIITKEDAAKLGRALVAQAEAPAPVMIGKA
jgi:hypothetical protein